MVNSSSQCAQVYNIYKNYRQLFSIYCILFFLYGSIVNSLGPLFPYLSQDQHVAQTSYSSLFIFRALGYLAGSIGSKSLQNTKSHHFFLSVSALLHALSSMLFTIVPSPMWYKFILMTMSGWACAMMNMYLHACIIYIYKFGALQWYLIVAHSAFGIGGLIGPILVYFLGYGCYMVLGICMAVGMCLFFKYQSPQQQVQQSLSQSPLAQKLITQDAKAIAVNSNPKPQLNNLTAYLMCPIFMLIVGQQAIYGGWISSYVVMKQFSEKESATFFSSLFWVSTTLFRVVMVFVPGRTVNKIIGLFLIGIVGSFGGLVCIENFNPIFGLYFSGVVMGLSTSVLYALGLSLPQQYNLTLTPSQSSNFILSSAFGEGVLAVLAGQLMSYFGPNAMFYFLGTMCFVGLVNLEAVIKLMKGQNANVKIKDRDEKINQEINSELMDIQMVEIKLFKKQSTATN